MNWTTGNIKDQNGKVVLITGANQGAFSSLYAATENIHGGSYIGPNGEGEMTGFPAPAFIAEYAKKESIGKELWNYAKDELKIDFL
jgi:hypothetical protein